MKRWVVGLALAVAGAACQYPAAAAEPGERPQGKWERKVDKNHFSLTFEDGRLHFEMRGEESYTFHADYSVTKDHVLYGVITSIECADGEEDKAIGEYLDAPFSFRFRLDEGSLLIQAVKLAGQDEKAWSGRYKLVSPPAPRTVAHAPACPGPPPPPTPAPSLPPPPPNAPPTPPTPAPLPAPPLPPSSDALPR